MKEGRTHPPDRTGHKVEFTTEAAVTQIGHQRERKRERKRWWRSRSEVTAPPLPWVTASACGPHGVPNVFHQTCEKRSGTVGESGGCILGWHAAAWFKGWYEMTRPVPLPGCKGHHEPGSESHLSFLNFYLFLLGELWGRRGLVWQTHTRSSKITYEPSVTILKRSSPSRNKTRFDPPLLFYETTKCLLSALNSKKNDILVEMMFLCFSPKWTRTW